MHADMEGHKKIIALVDWCADCNILSCASVTLKWKMSWYFFTAPLSCPKQVVYPNQFDIENSESPATFSWKCTGPFYRVQCTKWKVPNSWRQQPCRVYGLVLVKKLKTMLSVKCYTSCHFISKTPPALSRTSNEISYFKKHLILIEALPVAEINPEEFLNKMDLHLFLFPLSLGKLSTLSSF